MGDTFLGADQGHHLFDRVQGYAVMTNVPPGHAFPETVHARVGRILMIGGVLGGFIQFFNNMVGRRFIRVPHAQIDYIHPFGLDFGLHAVDFRE